MWKPLKSYMMWLHCRWPAGTVEKLPVVGEHGKTNVSGVRIVGDLTGIPLLKFSADTGAKAVQAFLEESGFQNRDPREDVVDIGIVGGGVSGISAAIEAKKNGLSYKVFEAGTPFSTIVNFPKGKPIYTYPTDMEPAGEMRFKSDVKEDLVDELNAQKNEHGIETIEDRISHIERKSGLLELVHGDGQIRTKCHRVIVAIGRSGNFRTLDIPGEDRDKVYNRLHDPKEFCDKNTLVVGGGDSALETAIALATCGSQVTLSYRKDEFSRPKPDNIEKIHQLASDPDADVQVEEPSSERQSTSSTDALREDAKRGSIRLEMKSQPTRIEEDCVSLKTADGDEVEIPNDAVFAMIGREAPLDFFRRSGITISGERTGFWWTTLILFVLFCAWLYIWKAQYTLPDGVTFPAWLDWNPADMISAWQQGATGWVQGHLNDPSTLLGTLAISAQSRGFYYTLAYCALVVGFGFARIQRRKTPYVTMQTSVLMAIQCIPLFFLPEIVLPLMGHNGFFDSGWLHAAANGLFPEAGYGHGREYWRAYGFILAWPLMAWNWFTSEPLVWWLVIGVLQTFVFIPAIIFFWGKGAYCGWICSCGALAETLGDQHRHKMPHGPFWNRFNMIGQVFLLFAVVLMIFTILRWMGIGWAESAFVTAGEKFPWLNYRFFVDLLWAGIIGYGLYFWFSGRVWCRFACPLAALMHIYTRFSRFRIFAQKEKCISCNVCTSVCHQGIDVMNFANKGLPMQDPECVRCSACVQSCPTGVLSFGRYGDKEKQTIIFDSLPASPVLMAEEQGARKKLGERQLEVAENLSDEQK